MVWSRVIGYSVGVIITLILQIWFVRRYAHISSEEPQEHISALAAIIFICSIAWPVGILFVFVGGSIFFIGQLLTKSRDHI